MEVAIITADIAPVFEAKDTASLRLDEGLLGMAVTVLEKGTEWTLVETEWGTKGYARSRGLLFEEQRAVEWGRYGKMAARAPYVDVLDAPAESGAVIAGLPKGGLLHPTGPQDDAGYLPVELPEGRRGYAKGGNLMPVLEKRHAEAKSAREALAAVAMSYLGVQYRKGGCSPLGIDDMGLVRMTYRLNGAALPVNCRPQEGSPLAQVPANELSMGDVLCFEGHLGLYLADGNYIHATNGAGSDGVVINSLMPASPFYRADLATGNYYGASLFV